METLNSVQGSFGLARVPRAGKRPLRAWDAADEYVLDFLASADGDTWTSESSKVIVVGDAFGALATGLASSAPLVVNESSAGRQAVMENLERNVPGAASGVIVQSILDLPSEPMADPFDVVVVKIPKSTSGLVEILHRLRPHVGESTLFLGAAMAKNVHTSAIDAFEKIIGPTTTSLAKKKARLIHVTPDSGRQPRPNPWPKTWKAHGHTLTNHGGGFSPNKLDAGTSLLLDSMRSIEPFLPDATTSLGDPFHVVDLGAGNGIIGLAMSTLLDREGVAHHVSAVDDSALAIRAAQASWATSSQSDDASSQSDDAPSRSVSFHHGHRLVNILDSASADLVVVNPPFHEDRVLGDETAWSMFVDAHKVLRPGGHLVVVGNRHLAHHAKLKKIFGGVNNLGSNAKFVVLDGVR